MQIAQGQVGDRMRRDDPGVLQRDDGQEHADTGGNSEFQRLRNGVDDGFAHFQQTDGQEDQAGDEDRAQRHLPGHAHALDHGEGEVSVQAHARRQRHRIIGDQTHDGGPQRGGQAGGDENGVQVHAGRRQNQRIDQDDVGHGQKGGETGQNFRFDRCMVFF
jgi:hypothetical protein